MQVTEQASGVDLNDSVKCLLLRKSGAIWSVTPDTSVFDAIAQMSDKRIGALVVLHAGSLVGILTERDYARKIVLKGRQSRDTAVREIMTAPVLYVTPEHTLGQCMHLMTTRRIRHLPVLQNELVLGMVSIGDLVNW